MIIRCPDCRHKWNYKGQLNSVVCASCGKRIKLETIRGKQNGKQKSYS